MWWLFLCFFTCYTVGFRMNQNGLLLSHTSYIPPSIISSSIVPPSIVPPSIVPPTIVPPTIVPPAIVPPAIVPPAIVPPTIVPPAIVPPAIVPPPILPSTIPSTEESLPPCQDCSCGERNEEPRVVGGLGSSVNAFPWLARLIYHKSFGCGASLINDKYVISAAHCIKGFMWFMFRVTFGEHDRCDRSQRPETRFVVKLIAHNFSLSDLSNDISLLRLNEPVNYNHAVRPVCLPKNKDKSYVGAPAIVAGWGATAETGNWSCTLLEADLPVLSNEVCQSTNYNASKIKDVMLCAGYPATAHKDACTGDSGGPLITETEDHTYELIGIVSWGYGCARKGYPGVYSRVTKYLDWIRDNTEDGCYCKY